MEFSTSIEPAHQEGEDEDRGGTRGSSEVVSINSLMLMFSSGRGDEAISSSIRSAIEVFSTP